MSLASYAVMLSGETAIGRFPIEAVTMMKRIICSTEEVDVPAREMLAPGIFGRPSGTPGRAVAEAAVLAAEELGCRLIVVITQSGTMGRRIAALRPARRIIALTQNDKALRQLALTWGVEPYPLAPRVGRPTTVCCFWPIERCSSISWPNPARASW
jgi:pyruvate kinase